MQLEARGTAQPDNTQVESDGHEELNLPISRSLGFYSSQPLLPQPHVTHNTRSSTK
jgi:hypothetical protein